MIDWLGVSSQNGTYTHILFTCLFVSNLFVLYLVVVIADKNSHLIPKTVSGNAIDNKSGKTNSFQTVTQRLSVLLNLVKINKTFLIEAKFSWQLL